MQKYNSIGQVNRGKIVETRAGAWTAISSTYQGREDGEIDDRMHYKSLGVFGPSEDAAIEFTILTFSTRLRVRYILIRLEKGAELRISEVKVFNYEEVNLIKPSFVSSSSGDPGLAVDGNANTDFIAHVGEDDGVPWLWIDFGKMEEVKYASIQGICSPTTVEEDIAEADEECQAKLILYPSSFKSLESDYIGYEDIETPEANVLFEGSAQATGGITIRVSVLVSLARCSDSSPALTCVIETIQAGDYLDPKSISFSLFTSSQEGEVFLQRRGEYATNAIKIVGSASFPNMPETRIRLERVKTNFRAFYANGTATSGNWIPVSSFSTDVLRDISLGLAVSPGDVSDNGTKRSMPSTVSLTGTDLEVFNITFDQTSDNISHTLGDQRKSENMKHCTAGYKRVFRWDRGEEEDLFPLLLHKSYEVFECNPTSDMPNYVRQGGFGHCADAYNQEFSGITFQPVSDLLKCRSTCNDYAESPGYRGFEWISPSSCRCLVDSSVDGEIPPGSHGTGVYEEHFGEGEVVTIARASGDGVLCFIFDFKYDIQNLHTGLCLDSASKGYATVATNLSRNWENSFLGCSDFCSSLESDGPSSGHVGMAYKEPDVCM